MVYATYEYYTKEYGGDMSTEEFKRLARQASAYLDQATGGQIDILWAITDRVKDACCAVAEVFLLNEKGGGIASESNDGISVNYLAGVSNTKTEGQRLYEAAVLYLGTTGLLYRGVR